MAYYRRNTLRCEFAGGADRPTEREVHRWVRTQLRVPDAELRALQLHTQHAVAFVKLRSDAAFLQLAERLCGGGGGAALQLQSGKLTPVRVSVADDDGGVEVRVFDVPLEVPDAEFRRALAPYGKVRHVRREVSAPGCEYRVATGVRSLRLVARDDAGAGWDPPLQLPETLAIGGHRAALQLSREASWCATSSREDGACRGCDAGSPVRPPRRCPRDVALVRAFLAHSGEWPPPDDVTAAAPAEDACHLEQRRAA
ncbi:uncharacterized protein LOC126176607 [Schistocerca cancellata]|uniref:uncharacterized protein LOC126176607 n=1 Tax=Schistocerca cancellata TaxID=274614 RepID=UPI0021192CA3|nr:uncharacterized protein LOC126176607 [Schistocerca cancellata]